VTGGPRRPGLGRFWTHRRDAVDMPGGARIAPSLFVAAVSLFGLSTAGAEPPRTRAERTGYRETSLHADVIAFLDRLAAGSGTDPKAASVTVRTIGRSAGGRSIPLAVVSRPAVASAAEARRAGKVVVYLQANIHAGEVEGKEATLMLLRELTSTPPSPLLDRLVILAVPIYNADGNDALADAARVRPDQDGPDRVGVRASGEGFDLNRDAMKAEALETRAVLEHVYNAWDPDVSFDLHTTDGTRHGFHLTYSPPLNPDTDPGVLSFARDELLPAVRARLAREDGRLLFDYGNLLGPPAKRGWYTFDEEGRYVTNYVGLRNRVSVLSEATSFRPFRERVEVTLRFVKAVLDHVARDSERVRALTLAADDRMKSLAPGSEVGVRFEFASRGEEPVPLEVTTADGPPVDRRKAPRRVEDRVLTIYDRFQVTRTARLPAAYLVPGDLPGIVALLRRHGADMGRLTEPWRGPAEAFTIGEVEAARSRFEGHHLTRLEGRFSTRDAEAPAGTFVVPAAQPLGTLVALLLEPESLDGAAAWEFLAGRLKVGAEYPILKAMQPVRGATERVP
jgi:hypothetical protein